MMQSRNYLLAELFLFFVLLPVSFALEYAIWVKGVLGLLGFAYIIFVLKRVEGVSFSIQKGIDWKLFGKRLVITFLVIAICTAAYVLWKAPENLFFVPINKPDLYWKILLVYTFLSVWPQEVIYRTFFFRRYEKLVKSKSLFVFLNAILFSLAHIFFKNTLVMILTFIGGLIFGITYFKFRSTTVVSMEHALYGNWLFTVGMGQMLAFPGMEASG